MSPGFAVFILMNNYFHDVATAMLLACGVALRIVLKQVEAGTDREALGYFGKLSKGLIRVAQFSTAWIVIGGIPRVLTFKTFEWPNAVAKHHEAGLIAKYLIAFVIIVAGACLWISLEKKIRGMKNNS